MHFDELCLHPKDLHALEVFAQYPDGGLLLEAEQGFGKETLAHTLASKITNGKAHLMCTVCVADKSSSITIEQIRELKRFFTLKTNDDKDNRVGVIVNAELMTTEAQNSFLKLLEEPPQNCAFILTSSNIAQLLPTILSRVVTHHLRKPSSTDLHMYLKKHSLSQEHTMLTNGLVGATLSLARSESTEITQSIIEAKELLSLSTVERLKLIDQVSKDKSKTEMLLGGLKIVATGALESAQESGRQSDKWQQLTTSTLIAKKLIAQNVSTKLVLTDLVLNIG